MSNDAPIAYTALFVSVVSFFANLWSVERQHSMAYSQRLNDWAIEVLLIIRRFALPPGVAIGQAEWNTLMLRFAEVQERATLLFSKARTKEINDTLSSFLDVMMGDLDASSKPEYFTEQCALYRTKALAN